MPFGDRCYDPNQEPEEGGREAFRLLIVKFYCSLERPLANRNAHARARRQVGCRKPCCPSAAPGARSR